MLVFLALQLVIQKPASFFWENFPQADHQPDGKSLPIGTKGIL